MRLWTMGAVLAGALLLTAACSPAAPVKAPAKTGPEATAPSTNQPEGPVTAPTDPAQAYSPAGLPPPEKAIAFDVEVGGHKILPGESMDLPEGPVTLTLTFPVAMNRDSVAEILRSSGLPERPALIWQDDRTLVVTVPDGGSFRVDAGFALSQDGTRQVLPQIRSFTRPSLVEISLYSPADLAAGRTAPASSWRVRLSDMSALVGPDGETALIYQGDPVLPEQAPYLLHLPTGRKTPLAAAGHLVSAGWLKDGRLLLVGVNQVFVGNGDGTGLKPIAEVSAPRVAAPSPDGQYLALWGQEGASLLNLQDHTLTPVVGPFRAAGEGFSFLAWSPDSRLLAGSDEESWATYRIRIIDPFEQHQVRTIEGYLLKAWLPGGDLVAYKRVAGGEIGAMGYLLASDGKEKQSLFYGDPSPDARWYLAEGYKLNFTLIDLPTGRQYGFDAPAVPRWTPAGQIMTVKRL